MIILIYNNFGNFIWEKINEKYIDIKTQLLQNALKDIVNFDINELPTEQANIIKQLQERISLQPELDITQMDEIVSIFNETMQNVWKTYLNTQNGLLIHATTNNTIIQDNGNTLSTSLYIPGELTETFINLKQAFIIEPDNIVLTSSRNVFSNASTLKSSLLLESPEQIKRKRLEKQLDDEFTSEIIVSHYKIIGFLALEEISEERKKTLQELGIPIKYVIDGKLKDSQTETPQEDILTNPITVETPKEIQNTQEDSIEDILTNPITVETPEEIQNTKEDSIENTQPSPNIPRTMEDELKLFKKWYSIVDKIPQNFRNSFIKLKMDIANFITNMIKSKEPKAEKKDLEKGKE